MYKVDEVGFEKLVAWAIDDMPKHYIDNMRNVAIVIEDNPSEEQKRKLHLVNGATLYGLYEGVPLPKRRNYSWVTPDKITIFKEPIESRAHSFEQLQKQVRNTVWHEIAHYYGLDHDRIHELERRTPYRHQDD